MNRLASGRYSYAKSYTDILAAAGQFAGVEKFGSQAFRNISSLQEAAQWGGFSEELIQRTVNDMRNSSMRAEAARYMDIFKRHDLNKIAIAKPGQLEEKVNRGTKDVFDTIEKDSRELDSLDDITSDINPNN